MFPQAKWAKDSKIQRLQLPSGFGFLLVSSFVSLYGDSHSINRQTPKQDLSPGISCHPHLPANEFNSSSGSKEWQREVLLSLMSHGILGEFG